MFDFMKNTGFQNIEFFSNFKQEPFVGVLMPLVIAGKK
jgi:hypothetical protein